MEICPPVQEEKVFEGFIPYMGVATILVLRTNFRSPYPGGSTYDLALIGQAVSEKTMFENEYGRTTTPEHGYTESSPMSRRLR